MVNVDWFRPFKHRKDISVGVSYMVIMNLPRSEGFKRKNVIIVGIIPALSKEPQSLNSFLDPLVDELTVLWRGIKVKTKKRRGDTCCTDLLCSRHISCGFVGHSANRGCSHCDKFFLGGFGEKKDYSRFDCSTWPRGTDSLHQQNARKVEKCRTKTEKKKWNPCLGQDTPVC